jgi:hypothetical protein
VNNNNPQSPLFVGFRTSATILLSMVVSACADISKPILTNNYTVTFPNLVCWSAASYKNQTVGDGHCISLIKHCTGAPSTRYWRPGASVMNSALTAGTVIATFKNNRYPNRSGHHAAIYIEHDENGIWVWDQWLGKPVHRRLIRSRLDNASASNTAQAYRVVKIDIPSKQ